MAIRPVDDVATDLVDCFHWVDGRSRRERGADFIYALP